MVKLDSPCTVSSVSLSLSSHGGSQAPHLLTHRSLLWPMTLSSHSPAHQWVSQKAQTPISIEAGLTLTLAAHILPQGAKHTQLYGYT